MGNAAIAWIERENAHNAQKSAQASIEIDPGSPQLQVSNINMPLAPIQPVDMVYTVQSGDTSSGNLAARQAFVEQVEAKGGPAVDPATASPSDWADYVNSYSNLGESPAGVQTLGGMVVTPDYSYVKASPAEEARFEGMNRYLDSVSVDQADIARVQAARTRQYATDMANQRAFQAWQAQDSEYLATLPAKVGVGILKSAVNGVFALPQQLYNAGKAQITIGEGTFDAGLKLLGGDGAAAAGQLWDSMQAAHADLSQASWVPFQNLSPEEELGGYALAGATLLTGYGEVELGEIGAAANGLSRLDYSANFANDLRNFNAGYTHFSGTLGDDLFLVQFHRADRALGQGRSAAWWTTPDQANQFFTIGDMRQGLALPPGWGARNAVSIARIPEGTDVEFFQGTALRQTESNILFDGNGTQYRFRNFDPNWIIQTRKVPGAH